MRLVYWDSLRSPKVSFYYIMSFNLIEAVTTADREHEDSLEFRRFHRQLFHSSLTHILQSLKPWMEKPHTVAQKTVPMFCHFEQTCTNLTLTPKPALEKNQGDSTASYLQFGALYARFGQNLTEKQIKQNIHSLGQFFDLLFCFANAHYFTYYFLFW